MRRRAALPKSAIEFSANFLRNYSNLPEETYSLYDIGPALVLRTKF